MKKSRLLILLTLFVMGCCGCNWAQKVSAVNPLVYEIAFKKIDTAELKLKLFYPSKYKKNKKYPAIVFFFGGGWKHGSINQFERQAKYFASKGMIAVLADYRTSSKYDSTPFDAVKDAKSAIRYLREYSNRLSVNTDKIVAAGGSAGGHLAAAADLTDLEESTENLNISSRPDAVVLFNPVINNGPNNYGYSRVKNDYLKISPYHNIRGGAAPTLILSGTQDKTVPVKVVKSYQEKMILYGNRCELRLYEGQIHGFYRYEMSKDNRYYYETLKEMEQFLISLGFLQ